MLGEGGLAHLLRGLENTLWGSVLAQNFVLVNRHVGFAPDDGLDRWTTVRAYGQAKDSGEASLNRGEQLDMLGVWDHISHVGKQPPAQVAIVALRDDRRVQPLGGPSSQEGMDA